MGLLRRLDGLAHIYTIFDHVHIDQFDPRGICQPKHFTKKVLNVTIKWVTEKAKHTIKGLTARGWTYMELVDLW